MKKFEDLYKKRDEVDVGLDEATDTLNVYEKDPLKQFLIAISRGATVNAACGFAMLSPKTVKEWLAKGDDDVESGLETNYSQFYLRYKRAEAIFEINNLNVIKTQAQNGSKEAAMWLLERRMPEYYSNKQEIKTTDSNITIKMDVAKA